MTPPVDARAFGALEAEVQHLREEMADLKTSVTALTRLLNELRGGWRVVGLLVATAAAIGAALAWFARLR
ncbi:hypothetical protein [Plastoroseomonas hellenica]|uniref:DUF3618 domain-containing protein n=1 Tax=Plastoroseomonas hellenica TaxID=2687306 RepID=A0ABS5F8B8_9PROT|nr:hypothetical protein [Plastoroseomonas hellenica]MBR0647709.1 hypothetical protein [Plastoroseomonas hellenica]MBR0668787.1 hypothetical protein [Plastoroseomonas hellenica]